MLALLPRLFFPQEIVLKKGSLIRLKYLIDGPALLVYGSESLQKSGALEKTITYLKDSNIELAVISGIKHCDNSTIKNIALKIRDLQPKWVIAIGGGTVIDATKLALAIGTNSNINLDVNLKDYMKPFSLPSRSPHTKFIAVPTTSGTGSEVSNSSIFFDITIQKKLPIVSQHFSPDMVILDPMLTLGLNKQLTSFTAIDAFTHAFESFCSTLQNPFTNNFAIMAGKIIKTNLEIVLKEPGNIVAREQMLYASLLAGLSQSVTSVGAVHAVSHALESCTGIIHGHGNALFLLPITKINAQSSLRPLQYLHEIGFDSLASLEAWIHHISELGEFSLSWQPQLSCSISNEEIATLALNDMCMKTNVKKLDHETLTKIITETRA